MAPDDLLLKRVDHLVYATPDLEASVTDLETRLGVRAAAGGRHPGRGTRNALLGLGDRSYLEIVGPDPTQDTPRWFGIDTMTNPRLTTWAANATDLDEVISKAVRNGLHLGPITEGQRVRSDGVVLSWKFTDPIATIADGLVPFFIDWGRSPHPAASVPRGVQLISMRGKHPQPDKTIEALRSVEIPLPVDFGTEPSLIAVLKTSKGFVELR